MNKYLITYDVKDSKKTDSVKLRIELLENILTYDGKAVSCPCRSSVKFEMDDINYELLKNLYLNDSFMHKAWFAIGDCIEITTNPDPSLVESTREIIKNFKNH